MTSREWRSSFSRRDFSFNQGRHCAAFFYWATRMTQYIIVNNVNTQLAAEASSSATTLTLASSANLPTLSAGQVMPLTLNDAATGAIYEIVYVTAITGVTLTVTRAQEGTGALSWSVGDYAFCAPTAGTVATSLGNPSNTFQVAPATASNQAAPMSQVAGVVGSVRNLVMSVTAASATATLTADEIIVETALGGIRYCLPSFSKTINLATTGAGGMDTGSAPVSGFCAIYAIYNPTTGTSALLATNATSAVAPNVYGGANMPSGYTASALVSVWPTNASSLFAQGGQVDRDIYIPGNLVLTTTTAAGSLTSMSIAGAVPKNARKVRGNSQMVITGSAGANLIFQATGSSGGWGLSEAAVNATWSSGQGIITSWDAFILTAQTIWYIFQGGGTTTTLTVNVTGYSI